MKKFLIVGGDFRQTVLARELKRSGYPVKVFGFDKSFSEGLNVAENLKSAVSESDVIVLGLPALKDLETVNTPLYEFSVNAEDIVYGIRKDAFLFGGMISDEFESALNERCAGIFDYYKREELIVKNVVPTVEGAIGIAINETAVTLKDSKCLVAGYGRIGKYLSKLLSEFGADVTVSARKLEDSAWICVNGYKFINTGDIKSRAGEFDIIFNTVPYPVIDKECIDRFCEDAVIIDLASKPGGTDINYAKYKGIKTIWALSLPGKTAPVTAGKIIKETIENILIELGV